MGDDRMEDRKLIRRRLWALVLILAALVGAFCYVLYDLQVVQGTDYLERSQRKIPQTETVDADRGEILDSLGRVLVSNRISYQTTLDLSLMGSTEQRNATLKELLELSREQEMTWTDTLPITTQEPFTYTTDDPFYTTSTDEEGVETKTLTQLGKLAVKMKWLDDDPTEEDAKVEFPTAEELLEQMCKTFSLEGGATAENRGVAGVLYELYLRSKDVTWSSYIFAEDVDIEFISIVKERSLAGVQFKTVSTRQYNTSYAAHLLGRVGQIYKEEWEQYKELGYSMDAMVGKDGVEKAFEEYLRGTSGVRYIETNTSGKIVSESWKIDEETGEELTPQPGDNVVLTLNIRLQEAVERALAEHVPTLPEAEGAAVVVLDVNDASVLAMASYPTYDLANFSSVWNDIKDDPLAPMYNRATQGLYPPGSTFKMVTAIGALEEGIITPTTKIQDTGKYMYYAPSYTPSCWIYRQLGRTHGLETVSDAIRDSCNVFFYDVGRRLGIDKLNEYARMFGLGEKTGIELEEKAGVVAGRDYTENVLHQPWYEGSTLAAAIGQENNQFTPLQLANYIATLVNGGNHYSAHLLKEVKSADFSEVVYTREPELLDTIDIDPVNLEAVKKGMLAVTQEGGSAYKYFKDLDIKVGAKTGSAQVSVESESNAVFVAFAPYDDPEIALCIVVEKGGSGSELGAIAADIISFYFSSEASIGAEQGENTLIR
ncbi:MAG: penicillin-binding transpeptidase domain-containing protein [Oscillospiraceae bacterium]